MCVWEWLWERESQRDRQTDRHTRLKAAPRSMSGSVPSRRRADPETALLSYASGRRPPRHTLSVLSFSVFLFFSSTFFQVLERRHFGIYWNKWSENKAQKRRALSWTSDNWSHFYLLQSYFILLSHFLSLPHSPAPWGLSWWNPISSSKAEPDSLLPGASPCWWLKTPNRQHRRSLCSEEI